MADARSLTLAFMSTHAADAARVLETLPVAQATALVAELPARVSAPALAAMLPPAAARILAGLSDDQALAVLTAAGTQVAVAILRHVAEVARERLVAGLPTASALASRVLLGFPEDAIGAWADPEVVALPPTTRVDAALQRMRQGRESSLENILIVDTQRHIRGAVSVEALLRAPETVSIATLMRAPAATLSAMMPVTAAAGLEVWSRTSMLPVVDRDERLIGVLHRLTVTRALRDRTRQASTEHTGSLAGALASSYWSVVSGLAGATMALLPAVKRVLPEDS